MIRKVLEEFRIEDAERLEWKSRFLTIKNRFFRKLSDYEE